MGTRGGDIDPSVLEFIHHKEGMSFDQIYTLLNKQSGLLGISGLTNDMRDLLQEERQHQDRRARLAIDIFCLRAKQYIGGYLAQMNGADAIIFTGGIGENAPEVRQRICGGLDWIGIQLDPEANEKTTGRKEGLISAPDSRVQVYVIPTNEELLIARDTVRCIENVPRRW
jgi:acetate kinase